MTDDVFKRLRAEIESQQQIPRQQDKESLRRRAEIEVEVERQLHYLLFFRTHIFSAMPDYLRTVLMLQRRKLAAEGIKEFITITFPVEPGVETDLGYAIPLRTERSDQVKLYQVLICAHMPGKPSRHFLISCRADAANAIIEVAVDVFDNLGRKIRILPGDIKPVDAFSEFKEGEFLLTVQTLVGPAVEACLKDLLD